MDGTESKRASRFSALAPLLATACAAGSLIAYKVAVAIRVGPGWDTYAFLSNAAEFAGKGTGYTEPHRPPLLSFLTSLVFRVGPLDQSVIQVIDGALTFVGVIALYLLLRRAVAPWLAAGGAVGLLAVTPLWQYLGVGYTDAAAVALSMCALLAAIAATERDPRWYLALGPLFVAAALMRFTALLFGFPIAVWLLLRWRPFRQAKQLAWAVGLAIASYVPAGLYYAGRFGDALFPFIFAFGLNEIVTAPGGEGGASGQATYYLRELPALMASGAMSWAVVAVLAIGAVGLWLALTGHLRVHRPRLGRVALAAAGVAIAIAAQFEAGLVVRQVTIPLAVWLAWRELASRDAPSADGVTRVTAAQALDAVMLAWLLTYADFHGHQTLQVPRYFITVAPSLLYFGVRGVQWLADHVPSFEGPRAVIPRRILGPALIVGSVAAAGILAGASVAQAVATPSAPNTLVAAARESADWLRSHDGDLKDRIVYSDLWPLTSWYLRSPVRSMPFFADPEAFGHELEKSHADYFLTLRPRRFPGYEAAQLVGQVTVLERRSAPAVDLPRVLYLGSTWDTYLESLCGYGFFLESTAGRYGWEGTAFLDALTPRELSRYDAVAAAGFRWRDMRVADTDLSDYLEHGGTVVMDASQNLGGIAYSVADTIMFDTVIRRQTMPAAARIEVEPAFAERHPELAGLTAAPWIDTETGGPWTGAAYEARPGTPALETLVDAGGRPLVQLQRYGKGRVYWIAYNLVWHAFSHESGGEARLVRAVFEDALAGRRPAVTGSAR